MKIKSKDLINFETEKNIMKKIILITALLSLIVLNSCDVAKGKFADVSKGYSYSYDGLTITSVEYYSGETPLSKNEIPYGGEIGVRLNGMNGFKVTNSKVMLLGTLKVKDKNGKVILENTDLFKENNDAGGLDLEKASGYIYLHISCASPLKLNESYTTEFSLKDKNSAAFIIIYFI